MANDAKPTQATPGPWPWHATVLHDAKTCDACEATRGPWRAENDDLVGDRVRIFAGGEHLALVYGPNQHANARLIAAAPQMRDALEKARLVIGQRGTSRENSDAYEAVCAALRAVNGEES